MLPGIEQLQSLRMTTLPSNLLSHAKASEAQIAFMEMAAEGRARKRTGLRIVAICMPIVLAFTAVLSLRQVLEDQAGFATKAPVHFLVPRQDKVSDPDEI